MDIKEIIKNNIKVALEEVGVKDTKIELEIPPDDKMGDLAFPCFSLSKILKKSPNEIAGELVAHLDGNIEGIDDVKVIGSYINFFYKRDIFLNKVLKEVFEKGKKNGKLSSESSGQEYKIMVEYSSPNTNKPLHLGHGRNNFLGMAVSNLLENAGLEVIRGMIINDRGIHICKSMVAYQEYGNGDSPEKSNLKGDHFIGKYYVLYNDKLKERPELEQKTQECLRKWEAWDESVIDLWKKMNGWYYDGVNQTYKKIGSKFDAKAVYYESDTYTHGKEIIIDALKKGVVYKKDDGAIAIDLTSEGLDEKILLRSDGTSVYITQDLYTAVKRFEEFGLHKLIYVVGNEQIYHFKVLFKILEKLGFDWAKNCYHLSYGMVNIPSGKLKSREGAKVDLDDLVENLKQMAMGEISKKQQNKKTTKQEIEERAMKIGLASLKFMLLRVSPEKDVFFNPKEAIAFEGDTGPYIMYAYTRIKSILKKVEKDEKLHPCPLSAGLVLKEDGKITDPFFREVKISDEEMKLAKLINQFPEILKKSADDLNPANLANYLLSLASTFNKFYHLHKVIDADTEELRKMRLILVYAVATILKRGMKTLGIEVVEEM